MRSTIRSTGRKARSISTRFAASAATSPPAMITASGRPIGWLTVTGLASSAIATAMSTHVLTATACQKIGPGSRSRVLRLESTMAGTGDTVAGA
jgi:hypothetical protein